MPKIDNIHDKLFRKLFGDTANVKTLLNIVLPPVICNTLDFSTLHTDTTTHISKMLKESLSDIVVECQLKDSKHPANIYILLEHKSWPDKKVLVQILRYMSLMWEKDMQEKKPLRIILPLIFYHGKKKWDIPLNFIDQFDIAEDFKAFLPDFSYLLFDMNDWNWEDEANVPLKSNLFLFSALLLLKAIKEQSEAALGQVFQLWRKIGFPDQRESFIFLEIYLAETMDMSPQKLMKVLEESHIKGDDSMPTLAERWREEGREEGRQEGKEEGIQEGRLITSIGNLISLMSIRFQLNKVEIEKIQQLKDPQKLEAALKLMLKADSKETVLKFLRIK